MNREILQLFTVFPVPAKVSRMEYILNKWNEELPLWLRGKEFAH